MKKWTKTEILAAAKKINPEIVDELKRLSAEELHMRALWRSLSDKEGPFMIDGQFVDRITKEGVDKIIQKRKKNKNPDGVRTRGDIFFLEWEGTQDHPLCMERCLIDVQIEERGSFYVVIDDSGFEVLRKKKGARGVRVLRSK